MYKVNITDGNISSIVDDLTLIQEKSNDNLMELVKTIFSKSGLVLKTENSFEITIDGSNAIISGIGPIVFSDGYISHPLSSPLSIKITGEKTNLFIVVNKLTGTIIEDQIALVALTGNQFPANPRHVKLYEINKGLVSQDFREENAAVLERNTVNIKSKPVINSISTSYNYDDIGANDFSHVNQRLAFLKIKWVHGGCCLYQVRICPCSPNGEEIAENAEYLLTSSKKLLYEVIDGKTYSIQVKSRDEQSDWSDVSIFKAGSDRTPSIVDVPQIFASKIRDYPTVVTIGVQTGIRDYPCYIEVYKNNQLLYTGPENTVLSILDKDETAVYKARVKGPCESSSGFVNTGFFTGSDFDPDFTGKPSDLIITIPINCSWLLISSKSHYYYPQQKLCLPLSVITKIAFESHGSYAYAATTPNATVNIEITKAAGGSKATLNISEQLFLSTSSSISDHVNYYKYKISNIEPEMSVDPDNVWAIQIHAYTNTANTNLSVSGTLHIHYRPKSSWEVQ